MKAAASGMKVALAVLRKAKALNAPGFEHNGKVTELLVRKFLDENPLLLTGNGLPADYDPLKAEQVRRIQFDLEVKQGLYVKRDVAKDKWAKAMEAIMDAMRGLMTREDFNAAIKQIRANIKGLDL